MPFWSGRPKYAIIIFGVSVLYLSLMVLPFVYSVAFPNEDISRFVAALKGSGPVPLDADTIVEQAKSTVGPLTRAVQIGYGYHSSISFHFNGKREGKVSATEYYYVAWFQKLPKPATISIALFTADTGQKAYGINEVSSAAIIRQYAIPVLMFGVSLFLVLRKAPAQNS